MGNQKIEERVIKVVSETFSRHAGIDKISRNSNFADDFGADSLDAVDMVLDLEQEFDIEIPDLEAEMFQTVGQVADYISLVIDKRIATRNEMQTYGVCPHC